MNCESLHQDRMECKYCGWKFPNPEVKRNCPQRYTPKKETPKEPSLGRKMRNFSSAVIQDVKGGMGRCSQEEIDERMAICRECPLFRDLGGGDGVCTHKDCGCALKRKRTYRNKLYWKSQSCPIDKWGPIE